ncbi:ribosome biogenesis protein BMS1 homolog [Papaver somniferum]|uniref:ribosome biogenesis protein BMS1 homolog n=1 Tax=Papaver somniferum TaxID=3469 RepID=UPI000E6FC65F|nr:ribosome biogenesis protein BMS1 homolog [Papaver somniferum]XP_026431563.1 ribosome biogenesis protein BMS1 homolog [Papaver somniferum]
MGVLTHLNQLKDYTKLNETEERLQDLFRTEIYQGAITYNISGLQDDLYNMQDVQVLAEQILTLQLHLSSRRAAHPFVLVDCFEDVTPPEKVLREANCGRNISLYGYLRGCDIKSGTKVHIAGLDDFHLAGVRSTIDPFPLSEENSFVMLTPMENETFRTGTYLRLEVHDVPFRMVANFYSCHPILVGGISPEDKDVGYMQAMLKRHNWHMKLLMSAEPVTMSAGWRRYGTKPIYARQIDNARHQIRDFIPEREHCLAMFWGPLAPAHTRITVVHKTKEVFRIAAKAVVLDPKHHFKIMKDSKRKGKPEKILNDRRTALIKFEPEDIEDVAAFKGASIRTDSGIWGKVIKAKKKGGC